MNVDEMIAGIVQREGDYVNHPDDPGGATRWGFTERSARAAGYQGHMRDFPLAMAVELYKREYVAKPGFLEICELDPYVGEEVVDSGVNAGTKRAGLWFQQALNVLNRRGMDYADIAEDGIVGPGTMRAFKGLRKRRGELKARQLMLKALNGLQFMHYYNLADKSQKFESFMVGWLDHRIGSLS